MQRLRPLALSDEQLELVSVGAQCVPLQWRARYLNAVADQFLGSATVTDDEVQRAVHVAIHRIGV